MHIMPEYLYYVPQTLAVLWILQFYILENRIVFINSRRNGNATFSVHFDRSGIMTNDFISLLSFPR